MTKPERLATLGCRWAITTGGTVTPGHGRLMVIEILGGAPEDDTVLGWMDLTPDQLLALSKGARDIARQLRPGLFQLGRGR